jgi:hypothetical protein
VDFKSGLGGQMALKPCKECKKEISTEAKTCPHCGKTNPTSSGLVIGTGGGCLLVVIVVVVIGTLSSNGSDRTSNPASGSPAKPVTPAAAAQARVSAVLSDAKPMCAPSSARVKKMIADHPTWENGSMANVLCKRVAIGMTAPQVRLAWGAPESINTTTYASGDHDQWVYGTGYYVYLENGIVTAMQTSK